MVAAETWQEILAPQALDLAVTAAFLALAMASFFLKSARMKYAALVFAVGYMGFVKSHLISVVDLFGVIDNNLPIARYNISYYALGIFVLASTVLWGRLYCGRICAFGAMTQLLDAVVPKRLRMEPPPAIERRAAWIKYALLAAVVVYFVATRDLQVYRYVDPTGRVVYSDRAPPPDVKNVQTKRMGANFVETNVHAVTRRPGDRVATKPYPSSGCPTWPTTASTWSRSTSQMTDQWSRSSTRSCRSTVALTSW